MKTYLITAEQYDQLIQEQTQKEYQLEILKTALLTICLADSENDRELAEKLFNDRIESAYVEVKRRCFEVLYATKS